MNQEQLTSALGRGRDLFSGLKDLPSLPVSAYSGDFPICLLLSQLPSDPKQVARQLQGAADLIASLRQDPALSSMFALGSDTQAILGLALLSQERNQEGPSKDASSSPAVEAAITTAACPHCGHDFQQCEQGTSLPLVEEMPATETPPTLEACPHCGHDFSQCAARALAPPQEQPLLTPCIHVDASGKCTDCTEEETEKCSNCENSLITSKAHRCVNFEDCGYLYCDKCKGELSAHGYCQDCSTISCDRCDNEVEAGEEKKCANPECKAEDPLCLCSECVDTLLNTQGLCATCSGEEEMDCSGCEKSFTSSRLEKCKNFEDCEIAYCKECNDLSDEGLCEECAEQE